MRIRVIVVLRNVAQGIVGRLRFTHGDGGSGASSVLYAQCRLDIRQRR